MVSGLALSVIPAKAGIQNFLKRLDSRLHGNDKKQEAATSKGPKLTLVELTEYPYSRKKNPSEREAKAFRTINAPRFGKHHFSSINLIAKEDVLE